MKRRINPSSRVPHQLHESIAGRFVLRFRQEALGNAGLIRNDNRENVVVIQGPHSGGDARQQPHAIGVGKIHGVFDERAITVEEGRTSLRCHPASARMTASPSS
jgi:hypothetical protein